VTFLKLFSVVQHVSILSKRDDYSIAAFPKWSQRCRVLPFVEGTSRHLPSSILDRWQRDNYNI